jgi:hypothetical protein
MHLLRNIRLFAIFGRYIVAPSLIINGCCLLFFLRYGTGTLVMLVWFKLITQSFTFFLVNSLRRHEYYYYYNLGISRTQLWAVTLLADLLALISGFIIIGITE